MRRGANGGARAVGQWSGGPGVRAVLEEAGCSPAGPREQLIRVRVLEVGERSGEPRRVPEPPEYGARPQAASGRGSDGGARPGPPHLRPPGGGDSGRTRGGAVRAGWDGGCEV